MIKKSFFLPFFLLYVFTFLIAFNALSATWYVNDNSTTGDVYCSAVGNDGTGDGSASAPYLTVSYVISNKVLGADDIVYIDSGNYNERWLLNTNADGGTSGHPLSFIGAGVSLTKNIVTGATEAIYLGAAGNSYITVKNVYLETQTNAVNTVYIGSNVSNISFVICSFKTVGASCIQPYQANYITVQNSTLSTSGDGIRCNYCGNHTFAGNTITMTSKAAGNRCGIFIEGNAGLGTSNNSVIKSNKISGGNYGLDIQGQGTGNTWQNNYIWDCDYGIFADNGGTAHETNTFKFNSIRSDKDCMKGDFLTWTIKNNIFYLVGGTGYYCINMNDASNDPTTLDYNLYYYPTANGKAAKRNSIEYAAFAANWQTVFNNNEFSGLTGDPLYSSSTVLDITSGSPAIDVASTDATVTDDVRRFPSYIRPGSNQDIGAFEYNATLPVELLNFSVTQHQSKENLIMWSTASEINNDFFTIERSLDGISFITVSCLKGAGNSNSILSYQYIDDYENIGIIYYRLKQTDYDGKFNYSKIVSVKRDIKNDPFGFEVYPNPSDGNNISLYINAPTNTSLYLELYNSIGQKVISKIIKSESGNFYLLDFNENSTLSKGIYFISLNCGFQNAHQKLIVE